jgi:hypothetical protein
VAACKERNQGMFDDLRLAFDDGLNGLDQAIDFSLRFNLKQQLSLPIDHISHSHGAPDFGFVSPGGVLTG